jgi:UDP-N-acetylglucosamine 4-epimerase
MINLKEKKILVTGGAGFIGSNLAEYLLSNGASMVRVLDNFSSGYISNLKYIKDAPNFQLINGDITNIDDCLEACQGIDIISHQAAMGSVPRSVKEPHLTALNNIVGFVNMVHAANQNGIKRFVYASSSSVYGDDFRLPKVEENIGKPLSPYAISKRNNEEFARNFAELYDMEFIGLRYFNVFGPKQSPNGAYAAVIPLFIDACLNDKPVYINGTGAQTRDFTFIDNVIQANIKAMFTNDHQALNKSYNIGCGGRYSVLQLFEGIKRAASSNSELIFRDAREGDILDSQADISKACKYLGYQPTVDFWEGLEKTVKYFKDLQ